MTVALPDSGTHDGESNNGETPMMKLLSPPGVLKLGVFQPLRHLSSPTSPIPAPASSHQPEPNPDVVKGAGVGKRLLVTDDLGLDSEFRLDERLCAIQRRPLVGYPNRRLVELLDEERRASGGIIVTETTQPSFS